MSPEKTVVLGPIIVFFGIFALLIFLFLRLVIRLVIKGRASSWQGELVNKFHNVGEDDDGRSVDYYTLVFKIEEGKTIKVGTSKLIWETYSIGDRAIKKPGTFRPEKIS